jgi:hypothetical protein
MARLQGEEGRYPEPPRYFEIVMALRCGVLPEAGGLDDQPADFIDAMKMALEAMTKIERSKDEEARKVAENAR